MQRPALYQAGDLEIWKDPYISKQMLAAHLNPNDPGASRSPAFMEQSVSWIQSIAAPGAFPALLDVGCGPGLYAERFAKVGYAVTGIDFSSRSIKYAQHSAMEKGLHISYVCQDYLRMSFPNAFDMAVLIYCDYGALSAQNRTLLLQKLYATLRPGGRLLLDVFAPAAYEAFVEAQTWKACEAGGFWSAQPHLAMERKAKYPNGVTLAQTLVLTETSAQTAHVWNCHFSPESLARETGLAGFQTLGLFGDVAGTPYAQGSPTLAVLLEKP